MEIGRAEEKIKFIELRGQGYSYRQIEKKLKISPATCTAWNEELKEAVVKYKAERLQELYNSYYMLREHRIKKLGETFKKIDAEINKRDFSDLATKELLDFYLKYLNELKSEYIDLNSIKSLTKVNSGDILQEFFDLLDRVRSGDITKEQAMKENYILSNVLKAYETLEIEQKIDCIKSIIGGRPNEKDKFKFPC